MPLMYPDLITSAPRSYTGMRDPVPPTWRPRFTHAQVHEAVGITQQCWNNWSHPDLKHAMPQPASAYMALLCAAHPRYRLQLRNRDVPMPAILGRYKRQFPPITAAGDTLAQAKEATVAFLQEHDISANAARLAFEYASAEEVAANPALRRHSVAAIGADPVRWAMLQLMCSAHPYLTLQERITP